MTRRWLAGTVLTLLVAPGALAQDAAPAQVALDRLADTLGYRFTVVDNHPACPAGLEGCFLSTITLTTPDRLPPALPRENLSLYFSFVNRLPRVDSDIFTHRLVNGDVQELRLKPGAELKPATSYTIRLWGIGSHFSKAFAMPNAYLAVRGLEARTIAATRPTIDRDTGMPVLRFVAPMTDEPKLATKGGDDRTRWLSPERAFALQAERAAPSPEGVVILPRPMRAEQVRGAPVDLVLMDVLMPQMDGPAACKMIRSVLGSPDNQIPIIGLTASTHPKDKQRCFEAGMNNVIVKPVDAQHLLQVLSIELNRFKTTVEQESDRSKAVA